MRAIGQRKFWGIFLPMDFRAEKRVRPRGSSLSLRLRSASDLCDGGYIDSAEKGVLKDLILLGDSKLDAAFDEVERGNVGVLKEILHQSAGQVAQRDLVDKNIDLDSLSVTDRAKASALDLEDIPFDVKPVTHFPKVKAEPSPAPSLPPRTRLDSRDVRMDFGRQGSFSSVGDGFTLGEDFGMAFLGDRIDVGGPSAEHPRSRSNSLRPPGVWSSAASQALYNAGPVPSSAAAHALMLGLSQHLPTAAQRSHDPAGLSPFISNSMAPHSHGVMGLPSPSMSPYFGASPYIGFATGAYGNITDLHIPGPDDGRMLGGGDATPTDAGQRLSSLWSQPSSRRRANSGSFFEPMASFRQSPSPSLDWASGGNPGALSADTMASPGRMFRGSFDAGRAGDRSSSMDDAWRTAGDVFDEPEDDELPVPRGDDGEGALLYDDPIGVDALLSPEGIAGRQKAHGKSLATAKAKPARKPVKPTYAPAPVPPPPPPAPPLDDDPSKWPHAHGTRLARLAATGGTREGLRRRRYHDDDDDDRRSNSKPSGFVGAYGPEARRKRILRFLDKRRKRVWTRKVKYDVRKSFADSRLRVKGRFVKKEEEELLRDLMQML